jgi:hypothetical protein
MFLTTVAMVNDVDDRTLTEEVFTLSMSNVVFTDIGGGFVEVTFQEIFDFSPIGGNAEPYSGTFVYATSVPPFSTPPDPDIDIVFYDFELSLTEGDPIEFVASEDVIVDGVTIIVARVIIFVFEEIREWM